MFDFHEQITSLVTFVIFLTGRHTASRAWESPASAFFKERILQYLAGVPAIPP